MTNKNGYSPNGVNGTPIPPKGGTGETSKNQNKNIEQQISSLNNDIQKILKLLKENDMINKMPNGNNVSKNHIQQEKSWDNIKNTIDEAKENNNFNFNQISYAKQVIIDTLVKLKHCSNKEDLQRFKKVINSIIER
jgi:hypothetical protein